MHLTYAGTICVRALLTGAHMQSPAGQVTLAVDPPYLGLWPAVQLCVQNESLQG